MLEISEEIAIMMDSMTIIVNIRKRGCTELLYTYVAKLAAYLRKNNPDILPEDLEHYSDLDARMPVKGLI